jgi:hypothetical protein
MSVIVQKLMKEYLCVMLLKMCIFLHHTSSCTRQIFFVTSPIWKGGGTEIFALFLTLLYSLSLRTTPSLLVYNIENTVLCRGNVFIELLSRNGLGADYIENKTVSNSNPIFACLFFIALKCLPSRCPETIVVHRVPS